MRVQVLTRPLERKPGWPSVKRAPEGMAGFTELFKKSESELRELGLGNWDGGLFLFPAEWFEEIPVGFPIETINGAVRGFTKSDPRDVIRGCLAYGVRIGPPLDDEDE